MAEISLPLNGIDFIEYAGPEPEQLKELFERLGFTEEALHREKPVRLFRQGDCRFVINGQKDSFAESFSRAHGGPSVCAMGFRVNMPAGKALELAVGRGAKAVERDSHSHSFPAVYGVGDSLIYFVEDYREGENHWTKKFRFLNSETETEPPSAGLLTIDHLTNNVETGKMNYWHDFYKNVFDFSERRYFDIRGSKTGLLSKVMRSPCNTITIPINEPSPDEAGKKSQIQEYIEEYKGAGIQHIALSARDIVSSVSRLRKSGLEFLDVPDTYYEDLKTRVPLVTEDMGQLRENKILADGDEKGYLLQIFTKNAIGPIFYEIIQRKGHEGFGEGNFQALFDAIERDQIKRGYIR